MTFGRLVSSKADAPMSEINVTPLVDVMLVMLIIFMVTVTLPAVGVPVELPESRAAPVEEKPDQITISIEKGTAMYCGETMPDCTVYRAPLIPASAPATANTTVL